MFQINTDFLLNQLQKYFYTGHLTLLLPSNKKYVLYITQVFRKIHFLPPANQFSAQVRCAVFQIKTNLLVIYQIINIFTQETLYPSFISKKNLRSPLETIFETSTFYHIFYYFKQRVRIVIFQINADFLINHLKLFLYAIKTFALFIAKSFRNVNFLPHFYQFLEWMSYAIFQININLLIIQRNINVFTQETLYSSFISKKIGALHRKRFSKHPLFTTFSLILTESEVCVISNKN